MRMLVRRGRWLTVTRHARTRDNLVMDNLSYSEPVVIGSQPVTAYEMIADITRMGEWSRVCKKCWWDDDASQGVGSWFTGRDEMGERTWETRSQVVAADQGHESAFIVGGDRPVGATASKRSTVAPRSPGPGSSSRATSRSSRSASGATPRPRWPRYACHHSSALPAASASISRRRFHFAVRSERWVEPTFTCPARQPTARSASQ